MTTTAPDLDTVVLDRDPEPVHCPYCDRPFDSERSRALHVGEAHGDVWTEAEQAAYEEARDAEDDALWFYHIKMVVGLGVTYLAVVLIYMIVLG